MFYLRDKDSNEWAKKYKIQVRPITCQKCTEKFLPTIPFITKDYIGLQVEEHQCGPEFQSMVYVTRSHLKNLELTDHLINVLENPYGE